MEFTKYNKIIFKYKIYEEYKSFCTSVISFNISKSKI